VRHREGNGEAGWRGRVVCTTPYRYHTALGVLSTEVTTDVFSPFVFSFLSVDRRREEEMWEE
jgi:hypothetical protein